MRATNPNVPGRPGRPKRAAARSAVAAAVAAAVCGGTTPPAARGGQSGDAVTISLSGSTAMRGFTISPGITFLTPGTSITLNSGPGGTPVTYTAPTGSAVQFQLAPNDFAAAEDTTINGTTDNSASVRGIRLEWHEQGSVEGIRELVDGQIDDLFLNNSIYQPTTGLATYVSRAKFGGPSPTGPFPAATLNGYFLDAQGSGARVAGAQSRVQMAISDVTARQGFSVAGTAGANRTPQTAGYGKGNPALGVAGLGTSNARQQLDDQTVLNFSTSKVDPGTGAAYAAGNPGEFGGVNNLRNNTVAITASLFAANPGTGLERLNRTDAQFLQATGRLSNGADFNVTTRDVNSGTRNVASLNVGLDPSFAVGENDAGDGNSATAGTAQINLGPGLTFSNKTAGGGQLRPVVQNARMAIGHLSMSDSIGSANNSVTRPLRALTYADSAADAGATFVQASAQTIVNGTYVLYQNETYVTVRRADGTYANNDPATEAIKGDNAGNDVRDFRQNILGAVASFPASSVANPADALVQNSFVLPQFMAVRKDADGLNQSVPNPGYNAALSGAFLGSSLAANFNPAAPGSVTAGSGSTYGNAVPAGGQGAIPITGNNYLFGDFDQRAPGSGISGKGVRDYSDVAVAQQAQAALFASGLATDMFAGAAGSNVTAVAGLPGQLGFAATKGDLIVLGDYNADGRFDGEDLRRMARGSALADSATSTTLTGNFADGVRNGVLRKNAALDSLRPVATTQQKIDARAVVRDATGAVVADLDPTGANAFNRFDVNRDGLVSRRDAKIVDYFVGKDYRNLNDQLGAVVRTDGAGADLAGQAFANGVAPLDPTAAANASIPRKSIDLVDVELTDNGAITHILAGGDSDMRQIVYRLQGRDVAPGRTGNEVDATNLLLNGDADFDGAVGDSDFNLLASSFGLTGKKWSGGDFDFDGQVGDADFNLLASNFGKSLAAGAPGASAEEWAKLEAFAEAHGIALVPEPGSAGLAAAAALGLLARRRRQAGR